MPYYSNGYNKANLFTGEEEEYFSQSLNDEVEILDEEQEDKKIEKLLMIDGTINILLAVNQTRRKINEIVDKLNKEE